MRGYQRYDGLLRDFVVMAKDASLYLADAQGDATAEAASKAGVADLVCEDAEAAVRKARELISMLPLNNLSTAPVFEGASSDAAAAPEMEPVELIKAVCDADTVVELKGECAVSAVTALASVGGSTVGDQPAPATLSNSQMSHRCEKSAMPRRQSGLRYGGSNLIVETSPDASPD